MRVGSSGPQVRELHERLSALGEYQLDQTSDAFDDATKAVVEAFQRSRGLVITGEVDQLTWARLLEASWSLGQRLLYLRHPNMRGDDVAELQVRLAQMGFNPGRIDGIFGPLTQSALREFQHNCGLSPTGELAMESYVEIVRLSSASESRRLVTEARAIAGFDDKRSGPLVLSGHGGFYDAVVDATRSLEPVLLGTTPTDEITQQANALSAALVLDFNSSLDSPALHLHYFASYRSHSQLGERIASSLAAELTKLPEAPRVEVTGMALPVLRETQMTTVAIEHGNLDNQVFLDMAAVFSAVLGQVMHR